MSGEGAVAAARLLRPAGLGVRLRAEQDARPSTIGEEFVQTLLGERCIFARKIYRFEDFESQWLAMNETLSPQLY